MELTKNNAAVCPDSIDAQVGTTRAVEIDLYDELITFAGLSLEEQSRLGDHPNKEPAQPEEESVTQTEGQALSEPVLPQGAVELDFAVQHAETTTQFVSDEPRSPEDNGPDGFDNAVEPVSATLESSLPANEAAGGWFEPVLTDAKIQTVESVPNTLETSTALTDDDEGSTRPDVVVETVEPAFLNLESRFPSAEPAEVEHQQVPTDEQIGAAESELTRETSTVLPGADEETTPPEFVPTPSAMEVVEAVPIVLKSSLETTDIRISPASGPRPSGPLSGFNLPPEIVYTGAMSRGVCLACGAESGADDLFCLTCGVFIDEIASTLPADPTCDECHERIDADEIFCPWCGSSVSE